MFVRSPTRVFCNGMSTSIAAVESASAKQKARANTYMDVGGTSSGMSEGRTMQDARCAEINRKRLAMKARYLVRICNSPGPRVMA
jgi:hypothetical protein